MGSAPSQTDPSGPTGLDAPSPLFRLSVDHRSASVIVGGELDRRHRHLFLDGLRILLGTRHRAWTVDLAAVTFCDTSGLAALVEGHELARRHQRDLTVVEASDCVRRQLRMAGLEEMLCASSLPLDRIGPVRRPLPPHVHRGVGIRPDRAPSS
jgi:anti-anti-sigma factor